VDFYLFLVALLQAAVFVFNFYGFMACWLQRVQMVLVSGWVEFKRGFFRRAGSGKIL
jgi:hypothetical protein